MAEKKWIQKANLKKGALTRKAIKAGLGVQQYARKHSGDSGVTGKQARLALTFAKMSKRRKK
jgi:hypothetical protein